MFTLLHTWYTRNVKLGNNVYLVIMYIYTCRLYFVYFILIWTIQYSAERKKNKLFIVFFLLFINLLYILLSEMLHNASEIFESI